MASSVALARPCAIRSCVSSSQEHSEGSNHVAHRISRVGFKYVVIDITEA